MFKFVLPSETAQTFSADDIIYVSMQFLWILCVSEAWIKEVQLNIETTRQFMIMI